MDEKDAYMYGSHYEYFIRRAFKSERGANGAETSYLHFLLIADLGKSHLSQPYDKQLSQVKKHLTKAVDKFLNRKPTAEEQIFLIQMKLDIENAYNATDLVPIIRKGLDKTIRYRDL